jgi:hypothetical protein
MNPFRLLLTVPALVVLGELTPVWSQDKVLVPGNPPLTQGLLEKRLRYLEWLLDTRFTAKQRTDYQRLFIQAWKTAKPAEKRHVEQFMSKDAEKLDKRQAMVPQMVTVWQKSKYPGDRWLLVVSGGLTAPQRQVLQDYLVKDWKTMTADDRQEVLGDLKRWADAAGAGKNLDEARKSIGALRPKLLARLKTTENRESSKWLLEIVAQERKKSEQLSDSQRMYFEAARRIIGMSGASGSWRFNGRRYEWVPGR